VGCVICDVEEAKKWYNRESGEKICNRCYLKENREKYYKNRREKYNSDPSERLKAKERSKEFRKNSEYKKTHKKYKDLTVEEKIKVSLAKKRYRELHREEIARKLREYRKSYYPKNKEAILAKGDDYRHTPQYWFSYLKSNSKRRGLIVNISFEEFLSKRNQLCHYCNGNLEDTGTCLDRRDNTNNRYDNDNSVPCCHFCNYLKGDMLTESETRVAIKAIKDFKEFGKFPTNVVGPLWVKGVVSRNRRASGYIKLQLSAKNRCIVFSLSEQDYNIIVKGDSCYYCNGPLSDAGAGIDRMDSTRGYTLDNCVPCCGECNDLKGNLLSPDEMMVVVRTIKLLRII